MCELKKMCNGSLGLRFWFYPTALVAAALLISPAVSKVALGQANGASEIAVAKPDVGSPPRPAQVAPRPAQEESLPTEEASRPDQAGSATKLAENNSEVSADSDLPLLASSPDSDGSSTSGSADSVRELSVEPGTLPMLPADRPAWIGAPSDFSQSVHRLYVGSQVTDNQQDIDLLLDGPLVATLGDYIDHHLLGIEGASLDLEHQVDANYIRKNLIDAPEGFLAKLNTGGPPMYQKWVTVSITPVQREQIQQWYREAVQRKRIAPVGLGLLGVIGFIGLSHLALRRRHGLPKAGPVVQHPVAFSPPMAADPAPRRRRGGLTALFVLGCVMVFPAMIAFSLLFWTVSRRTSPSRSHSHSEYRVPVGREMPSLPEMPAMPDMPEMPKISVSSQIPEGVQVLQNSDKQVIYRSGGQQIIIRKSPK